MANDTLVTWACVIAGGLCFLMYLVATAVAIPIRPMVAKAHVASHAKLLMAAPEISVDDVTKLMDAGSKLTDSLSKAGPAATSLVGAILFFAIAAFSSGALHGSPAPADNGHPAAASQPAAAPSK